MNNPDFTAIGLAAAIAIAVALIVRAWAWVASTRARRTVDAGSRNSETAPSPAEFAHYLQRAREREKRKFARSLHDELGSLLVAAKMDVENVGERLQGDRPELVSRLSRARDAIEQAVMSKRRIVEELYPSLLDSLGLAAAVEWEVSEACRRGGLEFAVEISESIDLPGSTSIMLFRIVQEALANTIAHAGATRVTVTIAAADANIMLLVEDDGVGIGDAAQSGDDVHGIDDMRQRARSLSGELLVRRKRAPESGTIVEANIPYPDKAAPATAA